MGQKGLNMIFSYIDIVINDLTSIQNVQGKKQLTVSSTPGMCMKLSNVCIEYM